MPSEISVVQEQYFHEGLFSSKIKVTNSVAIFCKYLIDKALNQGVYYYPSLKAFKIDEKLSLSSRTIDNLVSFLVKNNILTKLQRSKTQAYQVNINNPLFRFILNIYYPDLQIAITIKQMKPSMRGIKQLQKNREELAYILNQLETDKGYLSELIETLLNSLVENSHLSQDELKENLRAIIKEYCGSTAIGNYSTQKEKGD